MKKNKNNFLLLAGGCMILGVIVILLSLLMAGFNIEKFNTNNDKDSTYMEKFYEVDDSKNINKINVNVLDRDVQVVASDQEQINITYYENKKEKYEISDQGGTLDFQYKKSKKLSDYFNFMSWTAYDTTKITIEVPKAYSGELIIKNSSGGIHVVDLMNLANVNIQTIDDDVIIANVTAKELTVKNSSGSITLEDITARKDISLTSLDDTIQLDNVVAESNLNIKNSSGKILIDSATINQSLKLKTLDSTIDLSDVTVEQDGTIENTSGKIVLSRVTVAKSIFCKTLDAPIEFIQLTAPSITLNNSSGKISGDIIGKMSDYRITSSVYDGSNSLPSNKKTGEKELTAKTMDSNIEIDFTED